MSASSQRGTFNTPLLFLDVDGVLNVGPFPDDGIDGEWVKDGEEFGRIAFVPDGTAGRLARLLEVYEPVWCTAWQGMAHGHFREHLGLPAESWPYISYQAYKLTEILRYAGHRPWAWVDDMATWEQAKLGDHFKDFPNSLVIVPNDKVGLTDEHVDRLLAWAAGEVVA